MVNFLPKLRNLSQEWAEEQIILIGKWYVNFDFQIFRIQ
jgi:hypothetical protein